jgi:tRNA threonylcarbamoyladenosine biosynthesis protein TsaE
MRLILRSASPEETVAIARALGEALAPGDIVALIGELGAGKTLFCKGIGVSLGIPPEKVTSPSFCIVTEHEGRIPLTHVDVYRLSSLREAEEIGLSETFDGREGVCVVEWAEKVTELLPRDCIRVTFTVSNGDRREIAVAVPDQPRFEPFRARSQRFQPGG